MSARPEAHRLSRRHGVRRARWLRGPSRLLVLLLGSLVASLTMAQILPPAPHALPSGGKVVVGAGAIRSTGAQMTIDQASARLGLDWQSFNIGSAASVEFRQPSASAIALNRIVGNDASQIYGRLSANGQVFLTNPNGVLFAPGAKVDVGALVASTLDLSQSDFAAGRLQFKDVGSTASVVNQGQLAAAPGGYIGLFGRRVDNDGEIAVRGGSVLLASGHAATLAISDNGLLSAVIDPGATGQVSNRGLIDAPGSTVTLSARSAEGIAASLVNNSGIVRAASIVERNGEILLTGDTVATSGTLAADAIGTLPAGRIVVLGDMVRGRVQVDGHLSASAEGGDGGFVETSAARVTVADGARVRTASAAGRTGTWLIDPTDYNVGGANADISAATLGSNLSGTDITIASTAGASGTAGNVNINEAVAWSAHRLTLNAQNNILVNAPLTGTGSASLAFEYGQGAVAASNTSSYTIASPITLPAGGNFLTKLGSDGATQTFTVVVDAAGLQGIDSLSRTGNYAVGASIDLSSIANFNPIGNETTATISAGNSFGGRFEGLGNTVSGLTSSGHVAAGLFATTTGGADIRNLTLSGGSVSGTGNAGALAAVSTGTTVSKLRSTVAVSSSSTTLSVGGLIGQSTTGSISDSSVGSSGSAVAIGGGNRVGGLVGYSVSTPISNSSAGVSLTGSAQHMGGLVGSTAAAVSGSSSTGTATTSGSAYLGGLVGITSSTVTNSTSSVAVTATHSGSYVGGLIGASSAAVSDSTAAGAVSGGERVGGLVGSYTGASSISNSSAGGNVSSNVAGAVVGGLVGSASGTGSLTGTSATGNVSAATYSGSVGGLVGDFNLTGGWSNVSAAGAVSGGSYTGGLAGEYRSAAAITSGSYTGGSVNGGTWVGGLFGSITSAAVAGPAANNRLTVATTVTSLAHAGGFAGYTGGAVTNVAATGNVTSTGTGSANVGGLVGEANGAGGLTDVSASGSVTAATTTGTVGGLVGYGNAGGVLRGGASGAVSGGRFTGGLVGYFDAGAASIASSSASGNVSGLGDAGGIVAYATGSGSLSASSATGSVTSSATTTYSVGGIAGYFALSGGLASTTTAGNVTGGAQTGGAIGYYNSTAALSGLTTPASVTTVSGSTWVGGVIGYVNQATTLSGLSSSANVTATASGSGAAGGVAGRTHGSVANSSATGNVAGQYTVGGLVGYAEGTGTLTNSSASGSVTGNPGSAWIGGLVGRYALSGSISGTIVASGVVSGGSSAGGIVGYYNSSAPIAGLTRGAASVSGQDWVGGLVGYSEASSITGASSAANVTSTGTGYAAGGLVGRTTGPVSNSSASGSVTAAGDAGGLVGRAEGTGAFTDVNASGNVASSLNSADVGGLVGRASSGAITRGTASGTVSGGNETGGLVGYFSANASITSSEATGNVSGTGLVGGLIGYAAGSGGITDGTARGTVTGSAGSGNVGGLVGEYRMSAAITRGNAHGNVAGGSRTGGLTGYQYSSGGIANSHAYGNVSGTSYAGGLVGDFVYAGDITDSTAVGAVSGTTYAGGLVGSFYSAGSLTTNTASGAVTGDYAGGLLGLWQYSGGITDSRATGNVSGVNYSGGLIAYAYSNSGAVNNSSAGGNVFGVTYVGGLIGHSGYTSISRGTATGSVRAVNDSSVYVGGLIGYAYGSGTSYSISDSTASGTVTVDAPYAYVGGLIGQGSTLAISNGRASGSVTLQDSRNYGSSSSYVGGLVGYYHASNTTGISGGSRASGAVSGGYYAGGLVGYYAGSASTAGISDSSASGNVSAVQYGGGLVGQMSNVGIRNSQASGNVTVSNSSGYAGGLLGYGTAGYDGASINDSSATGNVTAGGSGYAGGLVGYWLNELYNTGTAGILNSRASGNVANAAYAGGLVGYYSAYYYGFASVDLGIRNGQASGSVAGNRFVGGLVGEFDGYAGIRDSSATGAVTGASGTATHYIGGLAGHFVNRNSTAGAGAITRSYATGNVALAAGVTMNTSTSVHAGGLVGQLDGTAAAAITLSDAYASGNVTLSSTNGRLNAGGLVAQANTSIDNAYSTGAVSASGGNTRTVGGLVAARSGTAVVATDSYWATDSSGQAASIIGSGRTLAQLQTAATFNGWDIASTAGSSAVWRIYEGFTTPLLRGFLTPLALTLANVSKTYDGTPSLGGATVNSSGGPVQFPDRIRVGGSGASADAGSYALSASNLYSAHNGYDLNIAGNAQLTINKKPLTLSGLVANKVYDATTAATVAGSGQPGGLVVGEDLLFQPAGDFALAFADKNAGSAKTVNIAGGYTWADGATGKVANYTLPSGTTTTADIAKATLNAGTFTATNRAYDGTTTVAVTATPASLSGVLGSDTVTVDLSSVTSGTIANKNVGSGKAVTVVGATITGTDAGNYSLAGVGSATVDITPRTTTVNGITASNRSYNRNTAVSINTSNASLSGVLAGDQVLPSLGSASGAVADKNVGDAKPVTITGLALRGVDSSNYTPQQGSVSVNITPLPVTIYAQATTGTNRVYDGTANAVVALYNDFTYNISNLWSGDSVTLTNTGIAYDNKNVAYTSGGAVTSKTITVSGLAISGSDAGNYALQNTTATTSGTISPKPLPVAGVTAVNRVYDGTRDVQVSVAGATVDTSVVEPGDNVNVVIPSSGTVTGQVANKNVGNGKAVTVPGLTITGNDAGNYTVNNASNGVTVNITRKDLRVNYTANDKVYDGGTTVSTAATSTDIVSGDDVSFYSNYYGQYWYYGYNPWASFSDKNVGTHKTVSANNESIYGNDAGNYNLIEPGGAIATASISVKPVTLAFSGVTKVYDGSTAATVTLNRSASGVSSGDSVSTTQTAEYTGTGAKNVGTGKPISVTGISFSGTDAANYAVANTTANTTGTVTVKPVTLSGITAVDRAYDGTTSVQVNATTVTSAGFVAGDVVSVAQPSGGLTSGTIASKNVGSAKPVTVSGLSLTGTDANNYSIDLAGSGITVNIGQKPLTPTYSGINRVYNGGVTVGVTPTTSGIEAGDTVTFSQQAAFTGGGARNVGTAKPVSVTSITLGGSGAANYALSATTASTTADVTPKPVTADYTGVSRVYNGLADTSISVIGSSLQLLAGDLVGFTQTATLTGDGSAGVNRPVAVSGIALTGNDAANYALVNTTASTTATITPRPLGVTGITATNRVYDGTTTVAVNVAGAAVDTSTKIGGDDVSVTLPPSGISTGTMADRHVGNAKPVSITGLAISGAQAANYSLIGASGLNVNITPAPLVASYTAADKVYNGNAIAVVTGTSSDIFAADLGGLTISATGTFTGTGAKNVGTAKPVAVRDGFLGGSFRDNYTLVNPTGSTTASITPRSVTASYASGLSKVYDGGVSAPASGTVSNAIAGDAVALAQSAEFTGAGARNVGNGKPIGISGITLSGADAGNYTLGTTTATTVGNITPKDITVAGLSNVTATDRVYDGTRSVQVTVPAGVTLVASSADIIAGDQVTIDVPGSGVTSGTMANKHVGVGKAVVVDGLSLSGTDGGNYRIAGTAGITVDISPKPLTASYTGVSRVYDGSANAAVTGTSSDIFAGDGVSISGTGVFTGVGAKNVGTAKPIDIRTANLSGADAHDYTLVNPTGSAFANITPRSLSVSYTGGSKVYDRTTTAPVSANFSGLVSGDDLGVAQTAVFNNFNVAYTGGGQVTTKSIAVSGITLSGGDAGNYTLVNTTAATTGTITPRPITIDGLSGIAATNRVYDGTTAVQITVSGTGTPTAHPGDIIAPDDVTVNVPALGTSTGAMADRHVGVGKAVAVTGLGLSGADSANYTIAAGGAVTVDITPKPVTATYSGVNKVYDGTTSATVNASSGDIFGIDAGTSISATGSFSGDGAKNVGSAKPIVVSGGAIAGAQAGNYTLSNPTGAASADITPRPLTASFTGGSRVYDRTTAAPVTGTLANLITGDSVSTSQNADFADKNVAYDLGGEVVAKPVTITGITLTGADAFNYSIASTSAAASATITPKPLTLQGLSGITANSRAYDGTAMVAVTIAGSGALQPTTSDVIAGDDVSLVAPGGGSTSGTMADKHVGTAKAVVVAGFGLDGADKGNYRIVGIDGVAVDITPKPLTASYAGINKVYDGTPAASVTATSGDVIGGDTVSITANGVFTGPGARNAGSAKPIAVSDGTLAGTDASNYALVNPTGSASADILQKPVTATYTGGSRVYDGGVVAPVSVSSGDFVSGDMVGLTQTAVFSGFGAKNAGIGKPVAVTAITLTGDDAGNYHLTSTSALTTADVTPKPITIDGIAGARAIDRVYDGSPVVAVDVSGATAGALTSSGFIAGDNVVIGGGLAGQTTGTMVDKHVGTDKPVAISGLTLTGTDAPNYTIAGVGGVTVTISPATLAVTGLVALDRVYDGTRTVSIDGTAASLSGRIGSDDVQLAAFGSTGQLADKNAGDARPVAASGVALAGADAGNYRVDSLDLRVNIAPRALSFDAIVADREYDGTPAATVSFRYNNRVDGDDLALATSGALFADKNAGSAKTVTIGGLSLTGADAPNYALGTTSLTTTASIEPARVTVTALDQSRIYGNSLSLNGTEFSVDRVIASETIDRVNLASLLGLDETSNAGVYTLTPSSAVGAKFDPANYVISYIDGKLTVERRPLSIAAKTVVAVAGQVPGPPYEVSANTGGLVAPPDAIDEKSASTSVVDDTGAPVAVASAAGGSVFRIRPSGVVFTTGLPSNYDLSYQDGLLIVLPKPPAIGETGASQTGSGDEVFVISLSPEEIARATGALNNAAATNAASNGTQRTAGAPERRPLVSSLGATPAPSGTDAQAPISLPSLLRLPLIALDAQMRRLLFGSP